MNDRVAITPLPDGGRLFSRVSGPENREPVLFLHGNRDNHSHWCEVVDALPGTQAWCVDFRAHGLSSKEDVPFTTESCVQDIESLVEDQGWSRYSIVGHSLGSVVAMVLALRNPANVSRLVLMGSSAKFHMKWKRPEVARENYRSVIEESNRRAGEAFLAGLSDDVKERVLLSWSWIPFENHLRLIQIQHPDLRSRLEGISCPTLVIGGGLDRSTPPEDGEEIARKLLLGEFRLMPEVGHFPHLEAPAEVADILRGWLA
ncbi:alpha/beta fold hydrolase [Cutibacterium sp. V947]|uniref:alpha/beta fold hydrolase n=1 Tax=unclassified Cutibacterium TaxID=2649671 RepID=UPI003EE371AC